MEKNGWVKTLHAPSKDASHQGRVCRCSTVVAPGRRQCTWQHAGKKVRTGKGSYQHIGVCLRARTRLGPGHCTGVASVCAAMTACSPLPQALQLQGSLTRD